MLFPDGYINLIDYGVAKRNHKEGEIDYVQSGTPDYMAPELTKDDFGHSFPCDWWSVGAVTFELMMGDVPKRDAKLDS
jgi:serine/threonine protein kinase